MIGHLHDLPVMGPLMVLLTVLIVVGARAFIREADRNGRTAEALEHNVLYEPQTGYWYGFAGPFDTLREAREYAAVLLD